jgi:hypothetical protein
MCSRNALADAFVQGHYARTSLIGIVRDPASFLAVS